MTDYTEFDGKLYATDPSYMVTSNGSSLGMTHSLKSAEEDYKFYCDESNNLVKLVKVFPLYNLTDDTFDYGFAIKINIKTNIAHNIAFQIGN